MRLRIERIHPDTGLEPVAMTAWHAEPLGAAGPGAVHAGEAMERSEWRVEDEEGWTSMGS